MDASRPYDPWTIRDAAEALLLVTAALETGLLARLESGGEPTAIARELELDERATSICIRALEALGVAESMGAGSRLSDFGRRRFLAGGDEAGGAGVANELPLWRASLRGLLFLDEVLRSGQPLPEDRSPEFEARLYRSLDAKPPARVRALVERALARAAVPRPRVLDVGGGAGTHARVFLERGCAVTLLDRPETIRHVRDAHGLRALEGLSLVAGDFTLELPAGPFDLVLLADVLHDLSPAAARALLMRAASVMAPAAVIAVAESFRGRAPHAALFAVTLLVASREGDAYGAEEVAAWLREAGFSDTLVEDLDPEHALLTARTPPGASRRSG